MTEPENAPHAELLEAYSKLIHELFVNGPVRLVSRDGHLDIVNEQMMLCSMKGPFLHVFDVMRKQKLVEELKSVKHDRIFALTNKGYLTAVLHNCRKKSLEFCKCSSCAEAFDEVLRHLLYFGGLQMVVGHDGHPHFLTECTTLCCDRKPFLEAICKLERHGLVSSSEDFKFRFTEKGQVTAQLMLMPQAMNFSRAASLN